MIIAMGSVIVTMGLLVVTGNTVHIMSSMIPIFIMPIAVLDSIHVLSEFFDRYPETGRRRETLEEVMRTLFTPMLYTSLTTVAGFGSLAFAPIPPVKVFGVFVAAVLFFSIVYHLTKLYGTKYHGVESFFLLEGGIYTFMFWIGHVLIGGLIPLGIL